MSNILKGLNERYFSRDDQDQQNAMDTRRRSDLSGERNAGLNEPDELPTIPQQSRNGVYEYDVPTGQEKIAQELGLQLHKGHWFSRVPVQKANFQFGRPQFHEIPAKNVYEAEQDYGPEYQDKVKRLGQMAKQGERKTVWDPVKRVYKTVPVNPAKQQGVAEEQLDEKCWDTHKQVGMKNKGGRMVPNCVPKESVGEEQDITEEKCPHCGGPMFSEMIMNEKKDACYYKVKSRYKVWPSAYASGALVKCRKSGADSWGDGGKKNESSILEGIEQVDENLHKWFKEKWVRFGPDGKIRGDCARGDDSEGKPKCLPQSKAHSLGKKGRASAASRKRREDPNPERHGKAINVNTKKKSNEGVAEGSTFPGSLSGREWSKVGRQIKSSQGRDSSVTSPHQRKDWYNPKDPRSSKQQKLDYLKSMKAKQGVAEDQLDEISSTTAKNVYNKREQEHKDLMNKTYGNAQDPQVRQAQQKLAKAAKSYFNRGAKKGVEESYDLDAFSGVKFLNPETGKMGSFYYWSSMEGKNEAYSMITNKKLVPAHNDGTPMTWDEYKQALDGGNQSVAEEQLDEKWSTKYKDSINCSNPKGFSQKAHCAGKQKNESAVMKGLK